MVRKRLRTIFASEFYRTKSININLNIIMEQLKPLSTKLKVSIMGGLPLIGGGKSDLSNSLLGRILFFLFCCLFSNNLFAQSDWRLVQDFESSPELKICTTGGTLVASTDGTATIEDATGYGKVGQLTKINNGYGTYGIVFPVSLGSNNLSEYTKLRIDFYYVTNISYKQLDVYVRNGSSGAFEQLALVNNGINGNAGTWKTNVEINISTTGKDYSDLEIFIASDNSRALTFQIDNIELYGPEIVLDPDAPVAPAITAANTYDGEANVTITPGANNHHVKYTISGSDSDVTNQTISAETIIPISGTGSVTITATGYNEDESKESPEVSKTITYQIASGTTIVWSGSQTFSDNWGQNVQINKSNFANLEIGDRIFLYASHESDVPNIGFRNDYDDSVFKTYTTTSGGNGAYGTMTADEEYWWLEVTDETLLNLFKNGTPRIQGQNFTLTKVEIHKVVDLTDASDNIITKYNTVDVDLSRSLVKDTWNTICLPFVPTAEEVELIFGNGTRFAEFSGVVNDVMQFADVNVANLQAGIPYLVQPTQNLDAATAIYLVGTNITAKNPATITHDGYSFIGIYNPTSFEEGNRSTTRFVGSNNKLLKPNTSNPLKALRAYFTVPGASSAKKFTFAVDSFVPTSIDNIQIEGDSDSAIYNIGGQRVEGKSLPKGIYIKEGKKFVVK